MHRGKKMREEVLLPTENKCRIHCSPEKTRRTSTCILSWFTDHMQMHNSKCSDHVFLACSFISFPVQFRYRNMF